MRSRWDSAYLLTVQNKMAETDCVVRFPQTRPPNHPTTGQRRVNQETNN
ncbi:hypothetical protein L798_06973 [Zootermopsis nevadensis]|uniref:Uncharacterized protein n=1 Tax=Zootermopsis nevadensis TaxID=136037 RepID=A0A067R509_ZOONE|nr:hypothetical protein L798_06973 [Zootermopsis nevadensis]